MPVDTKKWDYKVVAVDKADELESILFEWACNGWKYVGDYQSMGYTTRLIFERPVAPR